MRAQFTTLRQVLRIVPLASVFTTNIGASDWSVIDHKMELDGGATKPEIYEWQTEYKTATLVQWLVVEGRDVVLTNARWLYEMMFGFFAEWIK